MTSEITRWKPNWALIFTVASFVFGYAINGFTNYMSYTTKVDILTTELTTLSHIVEEMNKKLDDGNEKYSTLLNRVTVLETEQTVIHRRK